MPIQGPMVRQRGNGICRFPVIAGTKVVRRGDVVALVAAVTRGQVRAAAKKVRLDIRFFLEKAAKGRWAAAYYHRMRIEPEE